MRHLALAAAALVLAVPAHATAPSNRPPSYIENVVWTEYPAGSAQDLLTAGLGQAGLAGAAPPIADVNNPSAADLRRRAIYNNYRALVDFTAGGGYGSLYGPLVALPGAPTPTDDGKIFGTEVLAYIKAPPGGANVTVMVQIPEGFDPRKPCIVIGTSSGSRGVYGAIATAGEWGLKRRCAVAYNDKGTGNGAHDLQNDTVNLIDGVRTTASAAGDKSNFTARLPDSRLDRFNAAYPNRFAFKHAHSQDNPERLWGRYALQSVEFAFWVLNEKFGDSGARGKHRESIRPDNTIVIAASASNGAGAAIAAAEQDRSGLIDGVAVTEPNVQLPDRPGVQVLRGGVPVSMEGKPLYDYFTVANLFQPCAGLADPTAPFAAALLFGANRCTWLEKKGLIQGGTTAAQAADALQKLLDYGWEKESIPLHASHYATSATPGVTVTYANAYGRFSVARNVCGYSFAGTDAGGNVIPVTPANAVLFANVAQVFANGNGVPPTAGISIINNESVGGAKADGLSTSPSTNAQDYNLDGALCLRALATGRDPVTGQPLRGDGREDFQRVASGIDNVLRTGDLNGKPAIIVHGRADTLVPVNHSSRPYAALNRLREGPRSRLRYYEVENAQHFDSFIAAVPGYSSRYIPLHYYGIQALNLLWDHLQAGAALPPSQLVRTTPRSVDSSVTPPVVAPISTANVPDIATSPAAANVIEVSPGRINVPQ